MVPLAFRFDTSLEMVEARDIQKRCLAFKKLSSLSAFYTDGYPTCSFVSVLLSAA